MLKICQNAQQFCNMQVVWGWKRLKHGSEQTTSGACFAQTDCTVNSVTDRHTAATTAQIKWHKLCFARTRPAHCYRAKTNEHNIKIFCRESAQMVPKCKWEQLSEITPLVHSRYCIVGTLHYAMQHTAGGLDKCRPLLSLSIKDHLEQTIFAREKIFASQNFMHIIRVLC